MKTPYDINNATNEPVNENYYGSKLNELVANECEKKMVVINIDLMINDYSNRDDIRIIESKHANEKLGIGQKLLLKKIWERHKIPTYVVYGNPPYLSSKIYSFAHDKTITVDHDELIRFLNNKPK